MRAGQLRQRVTLQRRVETQGSKGDVTWSWEDVATVWAAVEPIAGREYFAADQVQSDVTTRIRIRYRPGVTVKMRAVLTAEPGSPGLVQTFDIEAVLNLNERDREIHLMCRQRDAEGFADDGQA